MSTKSDMKWFDTLIRNLKTLWATNEIDFFELMPPNFISGCSDFSGLDELFSASDFKVEYAGDFKAIPDNEWKAFIINNTTFE